MNRVRPTLLLNVGCFEYNNNTATATATATATTTTTTTTKVKYLKRSGNCRS